LAADYTTGALFSVRLTRSSTFHTVSSAFLAIPTFPWFIALPTLLNPTPFLKTNPAGSMADWFDPSKLISPISFYAWLGLYVVTPLLVPFLWWRNRRTDPGTPDPDDVVVPAMVRQISLVVGIVLVAIALFMFIFP